MQLPEALIQQTPASGYWDTQSLHDVLTQAGKEQTLRSTERLLEKSTWLPDILSVDALRDEQDRPLTALVAQSLEDQAKKKRQSMLFVQLHDLPNSGQVLMSNDGRGARRWIFVQ